MKNIDNQDLTYFLNNLGSSDMQSFINILDAYIDNCFRCKILDFGFNTSSGNVYIVLDNDISITSAFGQSCNFVVMDHDDGQEIDFNNYEDAYNYIDNN
jgi:hypothetical protein